MRKMLALVGLIGAAVLTGCMTVESGLQPQTSYSGYDQAREVYIQPHGTVCESFGCAVISVGGQWNEARPNLAVLQLSTLGLYMNMSDLRIRVDNKEFTTEPLGITDHSHQNNLKTSSRGFGLPLSVVRQIHAADSVWIRVDTPTGYVDYAIKDGDKTSKAYHALGRFLAAIDNG